MTSPQRLRYEEMEHASCGIDAVVSIDGVMTHKTVDEYLMRYTNL